MSERFFNISASLLLVTAIASTSACRQQPTPDPSMTAVRSGTGGLGSNSADWINPADIQRADELGLSMRDASLNGMNADNRIENLFEPIFFSFNQSFIRPEDRPVLQEAADYLTANPSTQLLIEGHCDWRGTTEYNMALGDRRAISVKAYLEQIGIATDRLETVSKGDLEATTEADESQMAKDRRADLIIIK